MKEKLEKRGGGGQRNDCPLKKGKGGRSEKGSVKSGEKVKSEGQGQERKGKSLKKDKGGRVTPLGGGTLHEKAEACRAWARTECEKRNAAAEKKALARFERGLVAKLFREECAYIIGLLAQRLDCVRRGAATVSLESFDAETAVRLLSSITATDYQHWIWNAKLSDGETVAARRKGTLIQSDCRAMIVTRAMSNQVVLRNVLADYARTAAMYAKSIASESVLQWAEILDLLERGPRGFTRYFPKETARRIVDLERTAADRLRIDKIVAELPSFRKAKGARR